MLGPVCVCVRARVYVTQGPSRLARADHHRPGRPHSSQQQIHTVNLSKDIHTTAETRSNAKGASLQIHKDSFYAHIRAVLRS